MSYNDEAAKAKLSALNETQDSIVTVAQWFLFHRRHAELTAQLWLQKLKDSGSGKRLNLIYLANEVIQQSKARKRDDFLIAFSPIIAEATEIAFKGASSEVQQKIRRVVEVWRQRQIFEPTVQDSTEAKIDELDKGRGNSKKAQLGGSLFSNGDNAPAPAEIASLVSPANSLSRSALALKPALSTANNEYDSFNDSAIPPLSLPVQAARLSALVKSLASAENAVSECMKARSSLIEELERLLESNRALLAEEVKQHAQVESKKNDMEGKRREVENNIMKGLSTNEDGAVMASIENAPVERPEYEALTPPPARSTTPPGLPSENAISMLSIGIDQQRPDYEDITPPPASPNSNSLSNVTHSDSRKRPTPNSPSANSQIGNGANNIVDANIVAVGAKRRKRSSGVEDSFGGFGEGDAMEGLDQDVVASLG